MLVSHIGVEQSLWWYDEKKGEFKVSSRIGYTARGEVFTHYGLFPNSRFLVQLRNLMLFRGSCDM